jgi:hypothetical protein
LRKASDTATKKHDGGTGESPWCLHLRSARWLDQNQARDHEEEEKEEDDVYKSNNKRGTPATVSLSMPLQMDFCANTGTQTTPTYEINDEVVMKVKTQKKTMFLTFRVVDSKQSKGKWVYQLKAKDGTLHDGGAWCAQGELAYP